MTRETKIGLLVGLAFIIVIGILLSDHMAATNEPPTAPLENAQATAQNAVVTPGQSHNPPITRVITPNDFVPPAPVPTQSELTQRRPIGDISITGPANTGTQTAQQTQASDPTPTNNDNGNTVVALQDPRRDLVHTARQNGEDIVDPNTHTSLVDPQPVQRPAGPKTYTIQTGDNLNKIALKTMGTSTKETRAAIVKANPKLAANPDRIIAGQTLVIPSAATSNNTPPSDSPTRVLALVPVTPTPEVVRTRSTSSNANIYIVKEGDNSLWGIAREQLGTGQAVAAIKELNKDVLKDRDIIRVGMRLKMPAKSVAMAD